MLYTQTVSIPQVTPITGLSQVNGWANVVIHPSKTLVCALSVSGKNANSVGKTISEQITHFAVTNSSQLHNSLLSVMQTAREEECQLQLACLLYIDGKAILATREGTVFLKRNHRIGEIVSSEGELKIIEGAHGQDDVFVLTTHQAAHSFPELKNIVHQRTEDLVPQLVAELHTKDNSALSAMAWVEPATDQPLTATPPRAPRFSVARLAAFLPASLRRNPLPALARLMAAGRMRLKNKIFFLAAGLLIITLLGAIFWKRAQINREVETLQPRFGELQTQLDQAKALGADQAIEARSQVREVMRGLEDLIAANPDKQQAVKVLKEEYQEAQAFAESISGTQTQGVLEPFFDLRLAEANFVAKDIAIADTTLIALDAAGERLALLDTVTKQTTQLPLEDIGTARAITGSQEEVAILADGLHTYQLTDPHTHRQLKAAGDSDRDGAFFGSFTSYLYVFNPQARNIYRYLRSDDELSEPVGWLIDKQGLEFDAIESMAIDGDLWLSTQTGQIVKYTQGQKQDFSVGDMPTAFDSALKLATTPDAPYLFVLEKNRRRLVVLQKDGTFVKEIVSDSLGSADTLAASPAGDTVYVASGSLVYKISP